MSCSTTTFIEGGNNFGKTIYYMPHADIIGWENHWRLFENKRK